MTALVLLPGFQSMLVIVAYDISDDAIGDDALVFSSLHSTTTSASRFQLNTMSNWQPMLTGVDKFKYMELTLCKRDRPLFFTRGGRAQLSL